MTISFVVRFNKKKDPRIEVLRTIKDHDGKRQKLISLGSLPDDLTQAMEEFKDKLDLTEQYQLENYVKNLLFNKQHFNNTPDDMDRDLIYFPPAFHKAVFELWQLAKQHRLDFTPHEVMLTALLNKTKSVERQLNDTLGQPVNVLEKIGLDIHRFNKQEITRRLHHGGQPLFKALLDSEKPLRALAARFNAIARSYQKNSDLKPAYIRDYAEKAHRFPLWYCGVALDLLLELGQDPLKLLTLEHVVNSWLSLRKKSLSPVQATALFCQTFGSKVDQKTVEALINTRYEQK